MRCPIFISGMMIAAAIRPPQSNTLMFFVGCLLVLAFFFLVLDLIELLAKTKETP